MLEFAYAGNILFVTPIVALLWFHKDGVRLVFGEHMHVGDGARVLIASLWTAIVLCSIAGVKWEHFWVPLLMFQVAYKIVFMLTYVLPRAVRGDWHGIPVLPTALFALGIVAFPLMIWAEYNWRYGM